jgi:hypothetical protein
LVTQGHAHAVKILKDNIKALHTMADALLEYETIDGDEVDRIVKGATMDEIKTLRESRREELEKERKLAAEQAEKEKRKAEEEKTETDGGRAPVCQPGPVTA